MDYEGSVIRPPSEAQSIILQVTVGCSHNRCTFCGAYKDVLFRIKDEETIDNDLAYAASHYPSIKKIFLADGDVLSLGMQRLRRLFQKIRTALPRVRRIRLYGNCRSIRGKSVSQLAELKASGLDRIYMGLESGLDSVLRKIRKGATADEMTAAGQKVKESGLFLSVTTLLGIAGKELSLAHARETARVVSAMSPRQIAALTLMPVPGTPLYEDIVRGDFAMPDETGLLRELHELVAHITLPRVQFQANHASNYLPIDCRLTRDRDIVLSRIRQAIGGDIPLMPDYMRGL